MTDENDLINLWPSETLGAIWLVADLKNQGYGHDYIKNELEYYGRYSDSKTSFQNRGRLFTEMLGSIRSPQGQVVIPNAFITQIESLLASAAKTLEAELAKPERDKNAIGQWSFVKNRLAALVDAAKERGPGSGCKWPAIDLPPRTA